MSVLAKLREDIEGTKALFDWIGDGQPVHELVAGARAKRCLSGNDGQPCPHNTSPRWWELMKELAADWIRYELELKSHMKLRVAAESDLHMCGICGCCLPLKIWAPIVHIENHLSKTRLDNMPSYCWIRTEIQNRTP